MKRKVYAGTNLRSVRLVRDMKQEVVASYLDMGQSAYSKKEKGEKPFEYGQIEAIAKLLGVSVGCLFSSENLVILSDSGNVSKDVVNAIHGCYQKHIDDLRKEVTFLRRMLEEVPRKKTFSYEHRL